MNYELNVLISGRKVDTYSHEKNTYIEGRKGSSYQLQLKNNTNRDALFVVSIDGLSIIDGKPASKDSNGYVVGAHSSSTIEGWLVDEKTAAKFTFGAKDKSYAAESGQNIDNTGVIGLQVFEQKIVVRDYSYIENEWNFNKKPFTPPYYPPYHPKTTPFNPSPWGHSTCFGSSSQIQSSCSITSRPTNMYSTRNASNIDCGSSAVSDCTSPDNNESLGTSFGKATKFETTSKEFVRASNTPAYKIAVYYETAVELNKRGIVLSWQKTSSHKPNPFPGDYCTPPTTWAK